MTDNYTVLYPYTVLYRDTTLEPADSPLAFQCQAEDSAHAEEQCDNAYPGCDIVWLVEGHSLELAYQNYYYNAEDCD